MENNGIESFVKDNSIVRSQKGLWNPKAFYWIAVLFSFLPAAILFSLNYERLGFTKKRNWSLVIAFIAFAIMIIIGQFLPQSLGRGLFYGLNIGAAVYMRNQQRILYNDHINNRGQKASFIVPVAISTFVVGVVIWALIYTYNIPDNKIAFNQSDLYYTENISKEDAQRLGSYLNDNGFFNNKVISIKIDKDARGYIFSIPIDKSKVNDQQVLNNFSEISNLLSKEVFSGGKLEIHLTDDRFNNLKTVTSN